MLGGFMIFSAVVGVAPSLVTYGAGSTGWLAIFPAIIALLPALFLWTAICRRQGGFSELCTRAVGKAGSKLLFFLLAVWNTIFTAYKLYYMLEKLDFTLYNFISPSMLCVIVLIPVCFALFYGPALQGRMAQLLGPLILLTYLPFCFLLLRTADWSQLQIRSQDLPNAALTSLQLTGLWLTGLYPLLACDLLSDRQNSSHIGWTVGLFCPLITLIAVIPVVAGLGATLTAQLPTPALSAMKLVTLFNRIKRVEAFVFPAWFLTDFISIILLSFLSLRCWKKVWHFREIPAVVPGFGVLLFGLSSLFSANQQQVLAFVSVILSGGNWLFMGVIPLLLWLTATVKERLHSKRPQPAFPSSV